MLPLNIETGRWAGTQADERVCNKCRNGNIEDEVHFLCDCPEYESCRVVLYESARSTCAEFYDLAIIYKFMYLMQYNSREVAKYLDCAFNIRKDIFI